MILLLTLMLGVGATNTAGLVLGVATVSYAVVLGGAVLTYLHWRLTSANGGDPVTTRLAAWLTVALTASAVNGLLHVVPLDDVPGSEPDRWSMVSQLILLVVLCAVAAGAEHIDVPVDPALIGAVVALVVTATNALTLRVASPLVLDTDASVVLAGGMCLAGLALAWTVLGLTRVSLGARRRLAGAAVLLTAAEVTTNLVDHNVGLLDASMVAYVLGALALSTLTHRLLRQSVLEHQAERELLQHSLAQVRAAVLEDRELLHEVGATLAGIATASAVMRQGDTVPAHRRRRLEAMLAAELGRLERLMLERSSRTEPREDRDIDLDAVLEPLVTSHRTRGRDVRWVRTGAHATGDPDELAEVVNILLENAAHHAGSSVVRLSVESAGAGVTVICSDSGPGVHSELRAGLFEREVRRPGSPGQGLGLAIAHRLATNRGGSLELLDLEQPGATFVVRLPSKEHAHGAASHVA